MTITTDGLLKWLPLLVTLAGIILVSRNARRANNTQMQNVDLARIRDLRSELAETKTDLDACKRQAELLMEKLQEVNKIAAEANQTATRLYLERQEMVRYASMPGVDIDMWLDRYGGDHQLNG